MAETEVLTNQLLQLLTDQDLIAREQAEEVWEEHVRTGKPVRNIIIDSGILIEDQLLDVIAAYQGTQVINLQATPIPGDVLRAVPPSVARMYNIVPVELVGNSIKLAIFDLIDPQVMDELMFVLTRDVSFVLAREEHIKACLAQYYGDDSEAVNEMLKALEHEIEQAAESVALIDDKDEKGIEQLAGSAPVVRLVHAILYQAVNDRASDIHFEPFEKEFKVRYRVDGALYEMKAPPKRLALPMISRIKVMSGLNIAERRLPQDGRIQLSIGGRPIDLRVSTLPTQFGESVVLRVLDRSTVSLEIENLGMPDDVYQAFIRDIDKPNGIIIVTGPTGCGKTTTLYSALRRLNSVELKLLTAEEPIEYDIEGIMQVQIDERAGVMFTNVLRSFLRQDPDVIMIGEIRDLDTAQIAIQASLTGHLVFSTLHTNDAPGAITRLIDMGVEPYLISSTLEAVLAQRLVRVICMNCKTAYTPEDALLEQLGLKRQDIGDRQFYFGEGCHACNQTGYHGRKGIFEYLTVTDPIREMINERSPTIQIKNRAVELGMRTLREDGIANVLDGYTTVEEILKYT